MLKKYADDGAGRYTALIAYFGLFSMFPLFLIFSAMLGFVLRGRPDLQERIVHSALAQFPIIGDQIRSNIGALQGSGPGVVLGALGALWGGLGVTQAMEGAMNAVWNVPMTRRFGGVKARLRGLAFLSVLGGATIASTGLSSFAGGSHAAAPVRVMAVVLAMAVNLGVILAAFTFMCSEPLKVRDVLPGAAVATALFQGLQLVGGWYVDRQVRGASQIYGFFAIVIGLLVWMSLAAQLVLYAAEANVVLRKRLWPRSLAHPPLTRGDKEVLALLARMQKRRSEERIEVSFDERRSG